MQNKSSIVLNMNLNASGFARGIKSVISSVKNMNESMKDATNSASKMSSVMKGIGSSAIKVGKGLAVAGAAAATAVTALVSKSVGAFAGLVLVRPDAQHTSSQQTNRNLCATREARMYTQPQLEIYADDVKCSHGATVGQLDENALFYMRQRGIPAREARLLLMFAFVNEVIDTIRLDALKDRLHLLVEKRFRGELNKCQGCAICK